MAFLASPLQAQDLALKSGLDRIDSLYQLVYLPNGPIDAIPQSGTSLMVIAQSESGELYFRMFNSSGMMMADIWESQIVFQMTTHRPQQLANLKDLLANLPADGAMTAEQQQWAIHYARHALGMWTTAEVQPAIQGTLEAVENLRGLSGLLAGFMIAVVYTLVHQPRRPLVAWSLVMTASSAAGFIVSAFICTFVVIICNNTLNNMINEVSLVDYYAGMLASTLQTWGGAALILTLLSSLPFAGAISLSGWLYSTLVGLITTVIGLISLALMAGSVVHVVWAVNV